MTSGNASRNTTWCNLGHHASCGQEWTRANKPLVWLSFCYGTSGGKGPWYQRLSQNDTGAEGEYLNYINGLAAQQALARKFTYLRKNSRRGCPEKN
jgi:hypothetical protein